MIKPPAHVLVSRKAKVNTRMVISIECGINKRIAVAMDHADRIDLNGAIDHVPVKRREQGRRRSAVKTRVMKENTKQARQAIIIPVNCRPGHNPCEDRCAGVPT